MSTGRLPGPVTKGPAVRVVSSLLDGQPAPGSPGGAQASTNPARLDEVVAEVHLADAALFVEACGRARTAQPAWSDVPAPVRGRVIAAAGRLVESNRQALAELVTQEVGKPYREALGEVQEIIDTCDFFLGEGRRLYGHTVPSEMRDKQLFTFRVPVGVCAIITAGNFPVAVPSWYLIPALLTGNTVVWKPAEYAAAAADALARILLAAGLPPGVLQVVQADGPTTFTGLQRALERGLVDKVGFTGSSETGREIGALCGRHLQQPCLELGGKNPLVVMPDAQLDLAVEGALFSGFGTAGQRCTSLGTVLVHDSCHEAFLDRYLAALAEAPVGDPRREVLYGPMMSERFAVRFEQVLAALIEPHHRVHGPTGRITAGSPRPGFLGDPDRGLFMHPTVVSGVRGTDALHRTETFGPIVGVARWSRWEELIELANGHGYGLSAAIYTQDPRSVFRFRAQVSAGMLSVNNSTSGAEAHLPFGGNGKSGNGARQSGVWVLDQFTRWQSMNWDFSGRLQKAQLDTDVLSGDPDFRLH